MYKWRAWTLERVFKLKNKIFIRLETKHKIPKKLMHRSRDRFRLRDKIKIVFNSYLERKKKKKTKTERFMK